jgi:glycerophosphoryl diester phosphodiesterase
MTDPGSGAGPRPGPARPTPILWAHRGASALAPENTLEAFELALRLGATGLESDVHLSSDGVPVLVHDATIRRGGGSVAVSSRTAGDLGRWRIPALADLYASVGPGIPLSLDLNDVRLDAVAAAVIDAARVAGGQGTVDRLHLCIVEVEPLLRVVAANPGPVWVHSADDGIAASLVADHARRLADSGVAVLNMRWRDWGSLAHASRSIDAVHRAGLLAFAWGIRRAPVLESALRAGADGVYADDPRELVRAKAAMAGGAPMASTTLRGPASGGF